MPFSIRPFRRFPVYCHATKVACKMLSPLLVWTADPNILDILANGRVAF